MKVEGFLYFLCRLESKMAQISDLEIHMSSDFVVVDLLSIFLPNIVRSRDGEAVPNIFGAVIPARESAYV